MKKTPRFYFFAGIYVAESLEVLAVFNLHGIMAPALVFGGISFGLACSN
jgi:hypothetical protein